MDICYSGLAGWSVGRRRVDRRFNSGVSELGAHNLIRGEIPASTAAYFTSRSRRRRRLVEQHGVEEQEATTIHLWPRTTMEPKKQKKETATLWSMRRHT